MKILISSHAFAPSIGGIETVGELLANEFVRLGHQVSVLTQTQTTTAELFPYPVVRRPSIIQLHRAIAWSDVFWQNNLSLRTLWPVMWFHRPVVITHHGSYCQEPAGFDLLQRVKHATVNRNVSVAVSRWVAGCFQTPSTMIPDPYDSTIFRLPPETSERKLDLIFLGRLVSEKGVDLLLQSLGMLKARQLYPRLTIVGEGPERASLEQVAAAVGVPGQVMFVGALRGEALATTLQQHRILVVPSRYDEPFGVVALEGIACGCAVVGSNRGGLPEAIGPCGVTFPNGDAEALTESLARLLLQPNELNELRANAPSHLAKFEVGRIAQEYLAVFQKLL